MSTIIFLVKRCQLGRYLQWHLESWDKICARKHIKEEHNWISCSSTSSNDWGNIKSLFHVSGEFISHVRVTRCHNLRGLIRNAWNWYSLFNSWVQKQNRREKKTQETIFLYFSFSLSHNQCLIKLCSRILRRRPAMGVAVQSQSRSQYQSHVAKRGRSRTSRGDSGGKTVKDIYISPFSRALSVNTFTWTSLDIWAEEK